MAKKPTLPVDPATATSLLSLWVTHCRHQPQYLTVASDVENLVASGATLADVPFKDLFPALAHMVATPNLHPSLTALFAPGVLNDPGLTHVLRCARQHAALPILEQFPLSDWWSKASSIKPNRFQYSNSSDRSERHDMVSDLANRLRRPSPENTHLAQIIWNKEPAVIHLLVKRHLLRRPILAPEDEALVNAVLPFLSSSRTRWLSARLEKTRFHMSQRHHPSLSHWQGWTPDTLKAAFQPLSARAQKDLLTKTLTPQTKSAAPKPTHKM